MCTSGEDEIQRLQRKLKEADDALQKAGQYGLQLLDGQLDLQNKLEEQRVEMTNAVEVIIHTGQWLTSLKTAVFMTVDE